MEGEEGFEDAALLVGLELVAALGACDGEVGEDGGVVGFELECGEVVEDGESEVALGEVDVGEVVAESGVVEDFGGGECVLVDGLCL